MSSNPSTPKRNDSSASAHTFISDLITTSLPSTSVEGAKQALSLRTTTVAFTRFVHKTGPVFIIQDKLEAIFKWQDPLQTLFVASTLALLCFFPHLILLLPSITIATILLVNHSHRYPPAPISLDNPYQESKTVKPPTTGQPPPEGSVDYFQNMQNIQELMARVSDLTDAGRSMVPYLNWSSPPISIVLLQLSVLSFLLLSLLLYFASPYLDMRYIFLFLVEFPLFSSHPFSISVIQSVTSSSQTRLLFSRLKALGSQIIADDALSDEVTLPNKKGVKRIIKEIVVYETERRSLDGSWSTDNLKGEEDGNFEKPWLVLIDDQEHISDVPAHSHVPQRSGSLKTMLQSRHNKTSNSSSLSNNNSNHNTDNAHNDNNGTNASDVFIDDERYTSFPTIQPPKNYTWVPSEEWSIDRLGQWNLPHRVDSHGWGFWDIDQRTLSVDPSQKEGELKGAARRRRKWVRRIVNVPCY